MKVWYSKPFRALLVLVIALIMLVIVLPYTAGATGTQEFAEDQSDDGSGIADSADTTEIFDPDVPQAPAGDILTPTIVSLVPIDVTQQTGSNNNNSLIWWWIAMTFFAAGGILLIILAFKGRRHTE